MNQKCPIFKQCGSCTYLNEDYHKQCQIKKEYCINLCQKANLKHIKVQDVIQKSSPYHYRNKVMVGFNLANQPGFYEENSHRIIPYQQCLLHDQESDLIIQKITSMLKKYRIQIYHEDKRKGFLRHVYIRRAVNTNQTMVVLVVTSLIFPGSKQFVKELTQAFPSIKTIILNQNTRKTSIVLGNDEKVIYGKGYIEDILCGLKFKISPKSFYQINHDQCEVLYHQALDLLNLTGNETLIDTYCGIGTIGLVAAKKVKQVIGVELNKDAIKDAMTNAKNNQIKNIQFVNDDASHFMMELAKQNAKIDVVMMGPPRSGTDQTFINAIASLKPKTVVYISCDPSTQVRDLQQFEKIGYYTNKMYLVDLFPQTKHIESIVKLKRK